MTSLAGLRLNVPCRESVNPQAAVKFVTDTIYSTVTVTVEYIVSDSNTKFPGRPQ